MMRITSSAKQDASCTRQRNRRSPTGTISQSVSATTGALRGSIFSRSAVSPDAALVDLLEQRAADGHRDAAGPHDEHAVSRGPQLENGLARLARLDLLRVAEQSEEPRAHAALSIVSAHARPTGRPGNGGRGPPAPAGGVAAGGVPAVYRAVWIA